MNPNDELHKQLNRQKKLLGLSMSELVKTTGLERLTLQRIVTDQPPDDRQVVPDVSSILVSHVLGLDPLYAAGVRMRDRLRSELQKSGVLPLRKKLMEDIANSLEQRIPWMNPFSAENKGLRLAFCMERMRRKVVPKELAEQMENRYKLPALHYERQIDLYEKGRMAIDREKLDQWLSILSDVRPKQDRVDITKLEQIANRLAAMHNINGSLETKSLRPCGTKPHRFLSGLEFHCPDEDGYRFEWQQSATVFGSVNIDVITVLMPCSLERSRVRLVNASHTGYEFSIVTKGRVQVVLSTEPFPSEELAQLPEFQPGEKGVISVQHCQAGDILAFPSHLFHRAEMLDKENVIISVNLLRDVALGRRLRRPTVAQ